MDRYNPYFLLLAFIVAVLGTIFAIAVISYGWCRFFLARGAMEKDSLRDLVKATFSWSFVLGLWWTLFFWREIFD